MAIIIRSITNNTPYTLTLKVPSLEENLSPVTIASHATLDLLTVVTEDDLIAMQLYLNGMVSRGSLTVVATIDTASFESGYTGAATWGSINGTLSSQTDLQNALNAKLNLSGGTMTGNVDMQQHQLINPVIQTGTTEPLSPVEGQIFYKTTTHQFEGWNGTSWVILG